MSTSYRLDAVRAKKLATGYSADPRDYAVPETNVQLLDYSARAPIKPVTKHFVLAKKLAESYLNADVVILHSVYDLAKGKFVPQQVSKLGRER